VNGVTGPPTRWQQANYSIPDGDCAGESIVVDRSQSLIVKLHLRSHETIQDESNFEHLEAAEPLELQDIASDWVADADTLPSIAESVSGLPAAPDSGIPRTDELDEWGLLATHLTASIPSTPVDCNMIDLSVPDSGTSQLRLPMLYRTDELNCWETGAENPLAALERPSTPVDYDMMITSVPDSGHPQHLSQHLESSNTNIGIEIVAGEEESVSEAGKVLCRMSESLEGRDGVGENHLQGREQDDMRQASRLDTQILIDRLEWVFVEQHPTQPKIDIRPLIERWNWVFPKDEGASPWLS
jgi:hypothetical protein